MAEAYRFNGPVPEAVKQLRERRRFRGSHLYETIKRGRRWDADGVISDNDLVRIQKEAADALAAIQQLVLTVEAKHKAGKPCV